MTTLCARWTCLGWMVASAFQCAACSSDSSPAPVASTPMTVEQWCELGPSQMCSARKTCCESGGIGWDQAKCEATERQTCQANQALVKGGNRTFDAGQASACVQGTQAAASTCTLSADNYAQLLALKRTCAAVFPGALAAGAPCDSSADCRADAGAVGICDAAKKCSTRPLTQDGDACVGTPGACDYGFYCDTWSAPGEQTCRALIAAGQACPHSIECVPTSFCDNATKVCSTLLEAGATCSSNAQCASFTCGIGNLCAPLGPFVGKKECGAL